MVKHIVVYTLKEGYDKDEAVALIASKLEPLVGQIPGLRKMEIRRCYAGMDYALYSEFEKAEDVSAYRAHPLHQEEKSIFIICWISAFLRITRFDSDHVGWGLAPTELFVFDLRRKNIDESNCNCRG